ncbi:ferrochelatase [Virgisporangium ochraceum]|uniref:ferrochelatase n=1 Tax=Virgisporangium ochraceum TaxID=65505 RepID=UPI001941AFBB|nr:ferrochelatase [Virgisporangium ochraceum]
MTYDAFLLLSFGGPEGPDDVIPFLENVTRGRGVPPERLAEVAEHYRHFGGVSPINDQCRALLAALDGRLDLPIYWGNRNWHPMLADTLEKMRGDGVRRAIAFVTSPYGGYSSCRQYWEDIAKAREAVGDGAPEIDKIRHYHDHPGFIEPFADGVRAAMTPGARLVFTAHSIPTTMDTHAGPGAGAVWTEEGRERSDRTDEGRPYPEGPGARARGGERQQQSAGGFRYSNQLKETARLVAEAAGVAEWDLVWQSRSGPPSVPWLEPDVNDHLDALAKEGVTAVVAAPIGFISDHLEVIWDLDNEAAETAAGLGIDWRRAPTPGVDPRFVDLVVELVAERVSGAPRRKLGEIPVWDACPAVGCCTIPRRTHG